MFWVHLPLSTLHVLLFELPVLLGSELRLKAMVFSQRQITLTVVGEIHSIRVMDAFCSNLGAHQYGAVKNAPSWPGNSY